MPIFLKKGIFKLLITSLFIVILFFHLLALSSIPRGFYCDEFSIGYNAFLIAKTGHDEHGNFFPIFFKSFGEFKNPLFIYLLWDKGSLNKYDRAFIELNTGEGSIVKVRCYK